MSTKTQSVIELVKVKSWYIPADAMSYQALKSAGLPMLIFHKDFLPTLQLATRRHNIRAREILWSDMLNTRLDLVGEQWKSKEGRSCKLTETKLIFLAKANETNRKAIALLEASLAKFFARWAFRYYPVFSETHDRYKLVVDFKFNPELSPIIPVIPVDVKLESELILGFTKIKVTFFDKPTEELRVRGMIAPLIMLEVFAQAGNSWQPMYTSTCKPAQIGNVATFIPGFAELFKRMKINEH